MVTRTAAFVVGCPRSGTTLLQQLLNAHPDISIGPETHFIHRFWQPRRRYGDLSSDTGWHALVGDVAAMAELGDMGIQRERVAREAAHLERHPKHLFRLLLELFGGSAVVTGEKTPNHVLHMPLLERWVPESRFLHVVRDPRAVVNSWRRVPWSSGSISGDADIWRRYISTAIRNPPRDGRLLTVGYEQLLEDPEGELRRVCRFIGVPFNGAMLRHHDRTPVGLDSHREPWKRKAAEPISRAAADRWADELTPRQVFETEATVGTLLERMGYSARSHRVPRLVVGPFCRTSARIRRFLARRSQPS